MNTSTLQDMWDTRPVRRSSGRTVAGVCVGIGDRYRVDPTLVKVAFVVATLFGGSGIAFYIAAAIVFPSAQEPDSAESSDRRFRASWIPLVIAAVIVLFVVGSPDGWGMSGLLGAALMLGGWYLLYQRTPVAPEGTSIASVPEPAAVTVTVPETQVEAAATDDAPPTWDPLGTAKFAWDLPKPPEPPAPRAPRSPVTPIVTGLAVITAAAGTAAHLAGVDWFTPGRIASVTLAVIGVGLIVASVQRRPVGQSGSGLVGLAVVGAGAVICLTAVSSTGALFPSGGVGDRTWTPPTSADLKDEYSLTLGSSTLDLRDLDRLDRDRTVQIRQGIGQIKLLLPDDIRVKTDCSVTVGDTNCKDGVVNADAKTPLLTIDAHVNVGDVEAK